MYQNENKTKLIIVTAVSAALITAVVVGGTTFLLTSIFSKNLNGQNNQNVAYDNSSNDDNNDNNNDAQGKLPFYSSSLDTMFFLPKKNNSFTFFETANGLNVNLNSKKESALIKLSDAKKIDEYANAFSKEIKLNEKDLNNYVKIKQNSLNNGINMIDIDYTQAIQNNLLPSNSYQKKVVLVKNLNDKFDIVLEFVGSDTEKYLNDLVDLMQNLEYKPDISSRFVTYTFGSIEGFSVNLDKNLWIYQPSNQTLLHLLFLYNKNFEKESFKYNYDTKLELSYLVPSNKQGLSQQELLRITAEKSLNSRKDSKYKNFNIVTPLKSTKISSKNAYEFEISYEESNGQKKFVYYALVETNKEFLVEIILTYKSKDSNAYIDFKNEVLEKNIKFD